MMHAVPYDILNEPLQFSYLSFWADFPARRKLGERKDFEKRWELCCAMEEMVRDKA